MRKEFICELVRLLSCLSPAPSPAAMQPAPATRAPILWPVHPCLLYQGPSPSPGVMIRPYLNGFTIAFNVSQPSTWQPYVDSMHHFLAGKLLGTPGVVSASCLHPRTHAHSAGVSSWGADQLSASHEAHLEREARKVVMGASVGGSFAFPRGTC